MNSKGNRMFTPLKFSNKLDNLQKVDYADRYTSSILFNSPHQSDILKKNHQNNLHFKGRKDSN